MSSFLFVSAQLPGHLDWGGYLSTAMVLQQQGHAVLWTSGKAVAQLVAQAAVPFHPLAETGWRWPPPPPLPAQPNVDATTLQRLRAERALDQWLEEERVARAYTELLALGRTWQPDVVIGEMFSSAAGLVAEALAKPFVVAGWPAMQHSVSQANMPLVIAARARLERLLQQFHLSGINWTVDGPPALLSSQLHLTYWSERWYGDMPLLPQTRHVGGRRPAVERLQVDWSEELPWVLITLGTSFGNDLNFFLAATQAASTLGCLPIVAHGGQLSPEQLLKLQSACPPETILVDQVNLDAILPNVAAAIHHGGAGTTHALVMHAVPQLVVPHAADQIQQALGVVRSGVGLHLPAQQVTVEVLVDALARLLPDLAPQRANAQSLRDDFANLGGALTAAKLLCLV